MDAYTIRIDEDQRKRLVAAFEEAEAGIPEQERSLLLQMLQDLPEVERDFPNSLHTVIF